jgi:hypothetical protein
MSPAPLPSVGVGAPESSIVSRKNSPCSSLKVPMGASSRVGVDRDREVHNLWRDIELISNFVEVEFTHYWKVMLILERGGCQYCRMREKGKKDVQRGRDTNNDNDLIL